MPESEANTIEPGPTPTPKDAAHRLQVRLFTCCFVLVMLVVAAIFGVLVYRNRPHFTEAGFALIHEGMTVDEVIRILGPPDDDYTSPRWGTRRLSFNGKGFIDFRSWDIETKDGRVTSAEYQNAN